MKKKLTALLLFLLSGWFLSNRVFPMFLFLYFLFLYIIKSALRFAVKSLCSNQNLNFKL